MWYNSVCGAKCEGDRSCCDELMWNGTLGMGTVLLELGWEPPNEPAETVLELSNNLSGCPCPLTFDPISFSWLLMWSMGNGTW